MGEDSRQADDLLHLDGVTEADDSGRGRNRTIRNLDIAAYFFQHNAVHDPKVSDPVLKPSDIAQEVDLVVRTVRKRLNKLEDVDNISRKSVGSGTVWWMMSDKLEDSSVPEKMQVILDVFEEAQAVYGSGVAHMVLSTAEIADWTGLSDRQVRERLFEMQGNLDVRQKSVGSGTVWWLVMSKDPTQPSLGDFDLSNIS